MKVSILIPCHNSEQWVSDAIASALTQDHTDKEVLVVDDGSTDGSRDAIASFGSAIRAEFTENRGGNAARNRLVQMSEGEWLQFLDADDYLMPNKISAQVAALQADPDCDLIYGPAWMRIQDGEQDRLTLIPIPEPRDPWILLVRWLLPQTGAPLWRKRAVMDVGGWNERQPVCQEHELYLRLLIARKRFRYAEHSGAVYRHWSENTVCRRDKRQTYRHRLIIVDRAETHLTKLGLLNPARQNAVNQTRFICARIVREWDRSWSRDLVRQVLQRQPDFSPEPGTGPPVYRLLFSWFGFGAAEQVAGLSRPLRSLVRQASRRRGVDRP
jgi:GT2 family glycosyltransferase